MNKHQIHNLGVDTLTKKFNLDAEYFLKGGLFNSIQLGIGLLCGLIVNYIFGHFLSKTVYGEYSLILSITSIFTFLSLPGIDIALIQSVGQGYSGTLIPAFITKIKISLVGGLILFAVSLHYFLKHEYIISQGILIISLLFPFLYSFGIYSALLTAQRKFAILALFASFSSLFYLLINTVIILWRPSTVYVVVSYLIGIIIPSLAGFLYCKKYSINSEVDKNISKYGSFLTLVNALPWISGNLGSVILGNILGVVPLATFSVANSFLGDVQKVFIVFYKPITAKLAQQTVKEHSKTILVHLPKFIAIGIFLCLGLWFVVPYLVHFLFPQYQEAIFYAKLLSLALIPLPITWVVNDMLVYQKKKAPQLFSSIVPQISKIILYFILIPTYKINGLILIILLDRYTAPMISLYFLIRERRHK